MTSESAPMSPVERFNAYRTEYGPNRTATNRLVRCVLESDYDALLARIQADAERIAGLERWETECRPLLEFLTGCPELCGQPVDYAKELYDRIESLERALAELEMARAVSRRERVLREALADLLRDEKLDDDDPHLQASREKARAALAQSGKAEEP